MTLPVSEVKMKLTHLVAQIQKQADGRYFESFAKFCSKVFADWV